MPDPFSSAGSCICGQVVFDLVGRQVGDVLTCSWCSSRYKYIGNEKLELLLDEQSKRTDTPASKPEKTARPNAARRSTPANPGPPGGLMPMIGFMIAFNALAIVGVSFLFQKDPADELRHALWDPDFVVAKKAIWPEIAALLLGNLLGFGAWAIYAYGIHKKERAERGK